jgi:CheY-like chemotaxis protein
MTKVLVVDDSSFARNSLRRILEGAGYEVRQADSGEAALKIAVEMNPEVVTLDLLMPGLSGQETLKAMTRLCPQTAYLVVTADIQEVTRRELMELGARAFLNKPIQKEQLLAAVGAACQ